MRLICEAIKTRIVRIILK